MQLDAGPSVDRTVAPIIVSPNKFISRLRISIMPPRFQPPRQTPSLVKPSLVLLSSGRPAKELGFKTVTQLNSDARGATCKTPAYAVKKIEGLVSGNAHHSVYRTVLDDMGRHHYSAVWRNGLQLICVLSRCCLFDYHDFCGDAMYTQRSLPEYPEMAVRGSTRRMVAGCPSLRVINRACNT